MARDYNVQQGIKVFTKGRQKKCIYADNIRYIEKYGKTSIIYLENPLNGSKDMEILDDETLKNFEEYLSQYGFIRIHGSILINGLYVTEIGNDKSGKFVKLGEKRLDVSERKIKNLNEWAKQ